VALTGDNVYVLYNNGSTGNFGGTSCAAPLWAAFTALVNQQAANNGRSPVGFLNPTLYNIGTGAAYTSNFHDTTTGNNFSSSSPTKFSAVAGFDLCTGWGTPSGSGMITTLAGPPDPLQVTSASFLASGTLGGPFTPNSASYLLTNNGATAINWTASKTANWTTLSASSGTLAPGDSVTVTWSLNNAANTLLPGNYTDTLTFTNPSTSVSQNVGMSLTVTPPRVAYFDLNTDPGWSRQGEWAYGTPTGGGGVSHGNHDPTGGATGTKVFGINLGGDYSTTVGGPYYLTTGAISTTAFSGTQLRFKRWLNTDYPSYVYATVDVSKDGTNWTNLYTNPSSEVADGSWTTQTFTLGAAFDNQPSVFIRWGHRVASSGAFAYSGWNLDDVEILGTPIALLSLNTGSATATEGDGPLTATITASPAPQADLVVTLSADNASKATVPATVMIPAGQTSATFPITIVNNALLDGTQAVNISASAAGYAGATGNVTVQDNETAVLSVTLPASTTEGAGSVQGSVAVSAAPDSAVTVALSSNDPSAVQTPASVTIAAGQTSANFTATIIDDNKINGTHSATLTAHMANWTDGTATIAVQDNETHNLAVTLPAGIGENSTGSGSVSISGTLTTDLTVTLVSANPTHLSMPASVTIHAGTTAASFSLTTPDNSLAEGTQVVSVTASAPGFTDGMSSTNVLDNDVDHFVISSIGSSQVGGVPFSVTITAQDVNGVTMLSYISPVGLSASGSAGAVALSPLSTTAFVNGVWTGNVTVATFSSNVVITASDGLGHTGSSNAFTVGPGPLHHFTMDPVANPQTANSSFSVTVTARDSGNNVVTDYTGTVTLSGKVPAANGTVLITEVNPNTPDEIEFMNVGAAPVNLSGWKVYIYDYDTWPGPQTPFIIPNGTTCGVGQIFRLQEFGTSPGAYPQFYTGSNINWTADSGSPVAVLLCDAAGNMKDFVCVGAASASSITSPALIPVNQWTGSPVAATTLTTNDYSRLGNSDSNAASFWGAGALSMGSVNPGLVTPFAGAYGAVPITPTTTGAFVNGVWTGNVAALQLATQMMLHADDGSSHSGDSNAFDVQAPGALTFTLPATANEGDGSVNGTVNLPAVSAVDVTVSLSSDLTARATVPATVLIPAGQISATFSVTIIDDSLLNGSQPATLTGTAPLYGSAMGSINIVDNENASLSVTLPATLQENQGNLPTGGTVTVGAPPDSAVVVSLTSSDPASLSVPATVTIAAGTTSQTFAVTPVDDSLFNGDRTVTVTAHVAGWTDGSGSTLVKDDESTANWPGLGNGPAHTGYQPVTLGSAAFTAGWSSYFTGNLQPVAVGEGKVFVTPYTTFSGSYSYVSAVDAMSGVPLWRYRYATSSYSLSPASVSQGRVFVERGDGGPALWCFDSSTGNVLWTAPIDSQGQHYYAPTTINGGVWVDGGSLNGLYGFNVTDGTQRFFNSSLDDFDRWSPAYSNGVVYTWVHGIFRAHDPYTGVVQWSLGVPSSGYLSMYTSPVVDQGRAFLAANLGLFGVDLTAHSTLWSVPGVFKGTPATANNRVYALLGDHVYGYDAATGAQVQGYATADSNINGQPIVTNDSLIVSSSSKTYIFDLVGTLRQTLPYGGDVLLANNILYVAPLEGTLRTYYLAGSPTANLAVSQTVSPNPAPSGTQVTITITATNNGPSTAAGAVVRDTLPPGVTFVSAVSSQGSCTLEGNVVTAALGDLANGASATVTVTATSNGASNRSIVAVAMSGTFDPDGTDNSATSVLNFDLTPIVTTYGASSVHDHSATLNATVNPNSLTTTGVFEYGTDTSYGNTAQIAWGPMNGTSEISISADLSGLSGGTTYHYRIKATNSAGTTVGDDMTFTTTDTRPTVSTLAATSVTTTGATLNGTVNGIGQSTTAIFEYGVDTSYGNIAIANPYMSFDSLDHTETAPLTGLTPGTTYHYRISATNNSGTRTGADLTFTTIGTDASLLSLVPSAGTLSPAFATSTTSYAETVPNSVSSITFTPTAAAGATVTVNGAAVASGAASAPITLAVGGTTVTIVVTAQDGVTTKTYTVVVTRLTGTIPFITTGTMPTSRTNAMAVLLGNGKVLVAGGSGPLATAVLYDPAVGTWSNTGSMITARYQATATLLPNGKVLVAGGTGSGGPLQSSELYDPGTGLWTSAAVMKSLRRQHCAVLLPNGKVLAAGGFSITTINTAEIYDPALNTWTLVNPMQTARAFPAGALLPDGTVLVAGGQTGGNTPLKESEIYDPVSGNWSSTTNTLQTPRYFYTLTLLPNGKALAAGGSTTSGTTNAAELYDPTTKMWSSTGNMTVARNLHAASLLPNGQMLVTGGSASISAESYDYTTGTWTNLGALPTTYSQHTSTLLPNGRMLLAAGGTTASTLYDPSLGSWSPTTAPMASGRTGGITRLLPSGKVLTAGGYNGFSWLAGCEIFDAAVGTWSATDSLVTSRSGHTGFLLADVKVLVTGGYNSLYLASTEVYDSTTGHWSPGGSLHAARSVHTGTLLPNGKVLVAGGYDGSGYLTSMEVYDPETKSWATTGNMAFPRSNFTATTLTNGKVLIVGGYGPSYTKATELYDPATGQCTTVGNQIVARSLHTATLLPSGKLLVAGGYTGTSVMNECELFDPATNTWASTGSMVQVRDHHMATLLPNGKVLVTGGWSGAVLLSSSELYDPVKGTWSATAGPMLTPRQDPGGTLLPNGRVLVQGGLAGTGNYTALSETFDPGLGYGASAQPHITSATSTVNYNTALSVTGSRFRGISGASVGNAQDSPTNYPLMQLRSLETGQTQYLLSSTTTGQGWSDTSFTSRPVAGFMVGQALLTPVVNGTPGVSAIISVAPPPQPLPVTLAATSVTSTSAKLNGTVNANGVSANVNFEYGTTTSYGASVTATPSTVNGSTATPVSATLTGLTPGVTYHYRVNGANSFGAVNGADVTFTAPSNDASLASLTLSDGALSPGFGGGTLSYTSAVGASIVALKVTPTASNANASIQAQVNADPMISVTSGSQSAPLNLVSGNNSIWLYVTAQDGLTTANYHISMMRATNFASWAADKGLSGAESGPTEDYDHDGIPNLLEYAFGTNPTAGTSGPMVVNGSTLSVRGGPTTLSVSNGSGIVDRYALFARRDDSAWAGLIYTVEFTADLRSWVATTAVPTVVADDGEIQAVSVPYLNVINGQAVRFFRVKVSSP
jgi:uncharacterized repeat protein (TIGR01451 family)